MNRRKDQRRGWIHGSVRDLGDASEFLHAFSRLTLISHASTINSRSAPCFVKVILHIRWLLLCSHHNILRFFCAAPSFVDCFFPIALLRNLSSLSEVVFTPARGGIREATGIRRAPPRRGVRSRAFQIQPCLVQAGTKIGPKVPKAPKVQL